MLNEAARPALETREPLSPSLGGLRPLLLKSAAQLLVVFALTVQTPSAVSPSRRCGGDVHDPEIHPDEPVRRAVFLNLRKFAGRDQIPVAVLAQQIRLTTSVSGQQLQWFRVSHKGDPLQPPTDAPDRHGSGAHLPGQTAIIKRLSCPRAEPDGVCGGPRAPLRALAARISRTLVCLQRGIRVGNLAQDVQRWLCGQPPRPEIDIRESLKLRAGRPPLCERAGRQPVRRLVTGSKSRRKCRRLFGRRQELDPHHGLHVPER